MIHRVGINLYVWWQDFIVRCIVMDFFTVCGGVIDNILELDALFRLFSPELRHLTVSDWYLWIFVYSYGW